MVTASYAVFIPLLVWILSCQTTIGNGKRLQKIRYQRSFGCEYQDDQLICRDIPVSASNFPAGTKRL